MKMSDRHHRNFQRIYIIWIYHRLWEEMNMYLFTENHTPAHIVKVLPKASDVFKVYGINFCCKGHIELKDVFDEMELKGASILAELNDADDNWMTKGSKATNWDAKSLTKNIIIRIYRMNYQLSASLSLVFIVCMDTLLHM